MWIQVNNNPQGRNTVGDCVIRAIASALKLDWYVVHSDLCALSRRMADMPSSNEVWSKYLELNGWRRYTCNNCLSVREFCATHPRGEYLLSTCDYVSATSNIIVTANHLVYCREGNWLDVWDSGNEIPLFYFKRSEK